MIIHNPIKSGNNSPEKKKEKTEQIEKIFEFTLYLKHILLSKENRRNLSQYFFEKHLAGIYFTH